MLRIGLTGGIGAGKSTVARLLAARGAVVGDADALAREVVAPGTAGLARVAAAFPGVVRGGALDRAALADVVFADPAQRRRLEAITHPLIGERTAQLAASVPAGGVFVHDVPLLVELSMAPAYHLVLVVQAPKPLRLERLVRRGLPEQQAKERMANQAADADRRDVADLLLDNAGTADALAADLDALWARRIGPYAANLAAHRPAALPTETVPYDPGWPRQAANLAAKITAATGREVEHVGPTAAGRAAPDVLDLLVAAADGIAGPLAEAGFPADGGRYVGADPGRLATVTALAAGGHEWRRAVAGRDRLRAQP